MGIRVGRFCHSGPGYHMNSKQFDIASGVLLLAVLCGCDEPGPVKTSAESLAGETFFLSQPGYTQTSLEPAAYAAKLLASSDGESYVLLLLARNASFEEETGRPIEDEDPALRGVIVGFQNAYVVAVIEALPDKPSSAVLWALTERLDDQSVGYWSTSPKQGVFLEHRSRPVREVAHAALVKRLHAEHEYDVMAWRKEIQQRAISNTRQKSVVAIQ